MKRMKKLASLFLAVVMVLSMTVAAFADNLSNVNTENTPNEKPHTITIQNANAGHNYEAYQIFRGDYFENKLSNITWGYGVDGDALLVALKADNELGSYFKDCTSAEDVAKVLAGHKELVEVSGTVDKFAKLVSSSLTGNIKGKFVTNYTDDNTPMYNMVDEKYDYVINVKGEGYYLVKDVDGSVAGNEEDAYTRYIMQVVNDVKVNAKSETPTIEKKIVEGDTFVDANTAGVGQVVSYQIKGNVPDRTGYKKYFYVISDKLSPGLTLNTKEGGTPDITVKVGSDLLKVDEDYRVYTDDTNYTFQVAFLNILDTKFKTDDEIIVTYSATVNDKAVIGEAGNPNKVTLIYSNNPNSEFDGDKDKDHPGIPGDNVPKGETPEDITITYVAEININKTANDENTPLPGAEFTLTGTSFQTVLEEKSYYEVADNGTYWLLKDGTYTTEAPTAEVKDEEGNVTTNSNEDKYVSTTVKYTKKDVKITTKVPTNVKMIAVSNDKGEIVFKGLGAGTYTIEETGVPQGYNKADNMIVVIECTVPENVTSADTKASWSMGTDTSDGVTLIGAAENETTSEEGSYEMTIINMSGALLPSTGGIGTTIFYAIGIILMAGAVFFVVRRKRA